MSYAKSNFKKGTWRAQCDRCGFDYHADQLKKEWTGFYVCKECWEPRHPQDFQRGVTDDPSVPWTRPEQTDEEVSTDGWADTTDPVPSGTNNNEL